MPTPNSAAASRTAWPPRSTARNGISASQVERPDDPAQPAERDRQEAADDLRVELRPGARGQLLARRGGGAGPAVGASRGHDLVGVGDRDDPRAEADLLTRQPVGVAHAVPALVVLADRSTPVAQPRQQARDEADALIGVPPDGVPLVVVERAALVQDLGRDGELAEVVDQRGPADPAAVLLRQAHLVGQGVDEGTDALGVAAGALVVQPQQADEDDERLGGAHRLGGEPVRAEPGQLAVEVANAGGADAADPGGRAVGEHERELEQDREREHPTGQPVADEQHDAGQDEDQQPPADPLERGVAERQSPADQHAGGDGERERHQHDADPDGGGEHRVRRPPVIPALRQHRPLRSHVSSRGYAQSMPSRLPLFPLSAVLLPRAVLPLHVFEDRYRVLVRYLLGLPEHERVFGVVAIRSGREVGADGVRALHDVGCAARLVRVHEHEDGRFDIVTTGDRRFVLRGVEHDRPYLVGAVDWLDEPPGPVTSARSTPPFGRRTTTTSPRCARPVPMSRPRSCRQRAAT